MSLLKHYIAIVFCIHVFLCVGQKHLIDNDNFNATFLEEEILEEINWARDSLSLHALRNDNYLKLAAINHSEFLLKKEKLTHFQPSKKYENPFKRVRAVGGGHNQVAENVAFIQIHSPDKKTQFAKTYEYLAKKFVLNWLESPPHFKNIKTKWSATSGISAKYNQKTGNVWVTHVFGDEPTTGNLFDVIVPKDLYNLKNPDQKDLQRCEPCFFYYENKPEDVTFGIQESEGFLLFVMNDKGWFQQLMQDGNDGFAVDIVLRDQFECGRPNKMNYTFASRGALLPPRYYKDFKDNIMYGSDGSVNFMLGQVPEQIRGMDYELNLVLIQDKFVCNYHQFFSVEGKRWELLDMPFLSKEEIGSQSSKDILVQNKQLTFTIPFQKNKTDYRPEDIKPLYDSLKLTDFDITKIRIRAFSSVEGSEVINHRLQEKRAESIASALESYQSIKMKRQISTAENWAEFAKDITGTKYSYLKSQSKTEVKKSLVSLGDELEPILKNHRKAIVYLDLEKKKVSEISSIEQGRQLLSEALGNGKLDKALAIQNQVFDLIEDKGLGAEQIPDLKMPTQKAYSDLLVNESIFRSKIGALESRQLYAKLTELERLDPNNSLIQYSIVVCLIELWAGKEPGIERSTVMGKLEGLKNHQLSEKLIQRLVINTDIIWSERLIEERRFKEKNQILNKVYKTYASAGLKEDDVLNLSKYFVSYSKIDWAERLMAPYARGLEVSEELLFYYITLSIFDKNIIRKSYYREILYNAVNVNKSKYCDLFKNQNKGGVSFQLLEDKYLKKSYCESCSATFQ